MQGHKQGSYFPCGNAFIGIYATYTVDYKTCLLPHDKIIFLSACVWVCVCVYSCAYVAGMCCG